MRRLPGAPTTIRAAALLLLLSGCEGSGRAIRRTAHYAAYRLEGQAPVAECWTTSRYRACSYRTAAGERSPDNLVYFLHYASGDEKSWNTVGLSRVFFKRFHERRAPSPTVVSVSFGPHWLLSAERGQREIVPLNEFVDEVMPDIEARLGAPKKRYLWGMSMGGYNAAELALQRPALWNAAVLSCPALETSNPFEKPESTAENISKRTRAPLPKARDGLTLFRIRLKEEGTWARENPIALAEKAAASPPILIQTNRSDEFGFLPGAEALDAALRSARHPAALKTYSGDHCVFDARDSADFIASDGQVYQ